MNYLQLLFKTRFFIYDLQSGHKVMSSYCMHGSGKGNTDAKPKFSNKFGSGCSSLGRYEIAAIRAPTTAYRNLWAFLQMAHLLSQTMTFVL